MLKLYGISTRLPSSVAKGVSIHTIFSASNEGSFCLAKSDMYLGKFRTPVFLFPWPLFKASAQLNWASTEPANSPDILSFDF